MYRLVNRQLAHSASKLAKAREKGNAVTGENEKLAGIGFFGINNLLMRTLPRYFIDFFVTKKSMTLVDSMLVEALRENGNFIEMLLVWLGVDEMHAEALRAEILSSKNVSRICFENEHDGHTVAVMWDYEEGSSPRHHLPMSFSIDLGNYCETVFNFALDNPFVIFDSILKAAHKKSADVIKVSLPTTFRTRFVEETFYRMFFCMLNAAARLTQEPGDDGLPDNLGAFDERYLDYHVSHALALVAAKAPGNSISLTFTEDGASCKAGIYLHLYDIVKGCYKLTAKATDRLIVAIDNLSFGLGDTGFKVIRNLDDAIAFDKEFFNLAASANASSDLVDLGSVNLGFPLVIATHTGIATNGETRLRTYSKVFYDVRTGTGVGSMEVQTRYTFPGEDGNMHFDVSASPWLSDQANDASLIALEANMRIIKRHDEKHIVARADGKPFTIHESFLDMLARGLTKGKPTEQSNFQLKHTARHELLGAQLKSITIDMTHVQPLETMVIVRA